MTIKMHKIKECPHCGDDTGYYYTIRAKQYMCGNWGNTAEPGKAYTYPDLPPKNVRCSSCHKRVNRKKAGDNLW